jgi:hypothetical protein
VEFDVGAIWQLLRAIWNGLGLMVVPFLLYEFIDLFIIDGTGLSTLKRGAHVWLYYWPTVFWSHGDHLKDKDEIATFLINISIYSVIAFVIARVKNKRIPDGTPDAIN